MKRSDVRWRSWTLSDKKWSLRYAGQSRSDSEAGLIFIDLRDCMKFHAVGYQPHVSQRVMLNIEVFSGSEFSRPRWWRVRLSARVSANDGCQISGSWVERDSSTVLNTAKQHLLRLKMDGGNTDALFVVSLNFEIFSSSRDVGKSQTALA